MRQYYALVDKTTVTPGGSVRAWRTGILRRYARAECAYQVRRLTRDPHRWIGSLIEASRLRGRLGHLAD